MEVSSPPHLSVASQDRSSTPCRPTPHRPPSQHSLDRDSPSPRARSPWSEVCSQNRVQQSFCSLMNCLLFMLIGLSLSLSLSQCLIHLWNENDKQAMNKHQSALILMTWKDLILNQDMQKQLSNIVFCTLKYDTYIYIFYNRSVYLPIKEWQPVPHLQWRRAMEWWLWLHMYMQGRIFWILWMHFIVS